MNTPFLRFVRIPAAIADYLVSGLATIVLFVVAWVLDGWVKSNRGGKRFSHRNPLFVGLNRVVGRVARDLFKQVERRLINWSRSRLSYRRVAPLRWVGPELTIQNGIYELPSPLTYCANSTPEQREPSCIDLSLPVGTPGRSARSTLADNPSYARLTPDQRANYLQWMSTGRTHPLKHMNYAFLFFYGLERVSLSSETISTRLSRKSSACWRPTPLRALLTDT